MKSAMEKIVLVKCKWLTLVGFCICFSFASSNSLLMHLFLYLPAAQTVQFSFGQVNLYAVNEVPCASDQTTRTVYVPIEISITPSNAILQNVFVVTISLTGNATCRSIIVASFAACLLLL